MELTLEAVLKNIPGGDSVVEKFKLIFPSVTVHNSTYDGSKLIASDCSSTVLSVHPKHIVNERTKKENQKTRVDFIPIKVINPLRKCESKTYMLNIQIGATTTLKHLREEILEQLQYRSI